MSAPLFIAPEWLVPSHVRALVTTRQGGVSASPYDGFNLSFAVGDTPSNVEANRALLRENLPGEPLWLKQVHGAAVVDADAWCTDEAPTADAAVSRQVGRVLAVSVADCLPVLIADDEGSVVGAAHAGWRGLSAGVIEATLQAMGVSPRRLSAFLGPAIGPGAFEVGQDVFDAFASRHADDACAFVSAKQTGKYFADLYALARVRLGRAGVERVLGGGWCTVSEPRRFFSFRRDKVTGRMAALIWLAR